MAKEMSEKTGGKKGGNTGKKAVGKRGGTSDGKKSGKSNSKKSGTSFDNATGSFRKIEHIGLAVRDLEEAVARYERTMGTSCYKRETVEREGVETAFFRIGESKIELLAATRDDSPVARFLERRGEGMHHMAFEVDDIHAEMERCRMLGYTLLSETPRPGADNKLVAFLHPKEHHGVLIELCQAIT